MRKFNVKDFKISFDKERTRIHYNGQYVIAELFGEVHVPNFAGSDEGFFADNVGMDSFWIHSKGIARPTLGDVYDEETGKRIALAKAENKAYEIALNTIMSRVEELLEFNNAAFRFRDKVENVKKHNVDYIERIGNEHDDDKSE